MGNLRNQRAVATTTGYDPAEMETLQLLRKCQLRQSELERQVLELRQTQEELETSRKNVDLQLRNKTHELQAIFEAMGDGVSVYDHNGQIQDHNFISPRLFHQETLAGKSCRDIFHPETQSSPQQCPVERALRGERVETFMVSARGGGETRYMDITTTPIEGAPGEKPRALVIFRDVTEKRLQELHLLQTEKMSSLGVLAAGVAHEINNPLTSVAGYAEALLRRFRDEPTLHEDRLLEDFPKYLEVIVRESYHCKGIIDSLLNFSRKSDGILGEVNLNGILREILELLRPQSCNGKIEVVTRLQQELPPVLGNPSGLRQVFMNLLLNAHQSITGAGLVEITTEHGNHDSMVGVRIRDTGCGIAREVIDQIWNPFFTTKEVGQGLGLGLALSYNIVKRHGGFINVESQTGKGSQFTVRLPTCQGDMHRRSIAD